MRGGWFTFPGNIYKCPTCGKDAEVYSRITGYYRPVRNWNDGKAQEFIDRREYVISKAGSHPAAAQRQPAELEQQPQASQEQTMPQAGPEQLLLFTTPHLCQLRSGKRIADKTPGSPMS